jgi:ATP-dependent RNA helicase SUPV3L1/SUV3
LSRGGWDTKGLIQAFEGDGSGFPKTLEGNMLRHFLTFASQHPDHLPDNLRTHLSSILDVTDLSKLAFQGENSTARQIRRHFHLHMGPTNSGKTYSALKALGKADTGAYAGPLRLLAHEVWERMNLGTVGGLDGVGKDCNLLTGEERRIVSPDAGLLSCTVEMVPLSPPGGGLYDVVVIDEIQMMADPQRGGAWTKAVLGMRAKEIHLCGDETTRALLETLLPSLGDEVTVHKYDRLAPLSVAEESLEGQWDRVEDGDCIVTFSRNNIFSVKKMVEEQAGKKCAVVYGALPPETRAEQARSFNEEDGLAKVLVASDAIGMGLNL